MVLMAAEPPIDLNTLSGAFSGYKAPAAIHSVIQDTDHIPALYKGSGGTVTSFLSVTPSGINIEVQSYAKNKLAQAIDEVCSAFRLTKEEFTQICHVQSRKTLYNWINGETEPRKAAMNRIFDLVIVARAWVSYGLNAYNSQLYEQIIDNQSVLDLLSQQVIDQDKILFSGSKLSMSFPTQGSLSDPFA